MTKIDIIITANAERLKVKIVATNAINKAIFPFFPLLPQPYFL